MRSLGFVLCFIVATAVFPPANAQQTFSVTAPVAQPEIVVSCISDHPDAIYRVGEKATFTITVSKDGKPVDGASFSWSLTKDGVPPIQEGTAALKAGKAVVTGQLNEPGFLQCKIKLDTAHAGARGLGAVAYEPLLIKQSLPPPDDFDAFWAAKKHELAQVPLNAKITPVADTTPGIDVFEIRADSLGQRPISGYYARPKNLRPKSAPAILILEGAGVYGTRLPFPKQWATDGYLALEINAHGILNGQPIDYYQGLDKGALKDYQFQGRESRESSYFLHMYLRALRGADFLAAQPEWDGRVLISYGASQGAAQAIFVAANDPRVSFLAAMVPAMCDHSGLVANRVPGWPRMVPLDAQGKPDAQILETSGYFDSVNFATRVRVPSFFVAGFIDQITPPTSVYAAYNSLPATKDIYPAIHSPHKIEPAIWELVRQKVLKAK